MTAIDSDIPKIRVRTLLETPIQSTGDYVLYWMTAFRRTTYNFALDRAIDYSKALGKPLVVLEAVRVRYPWSSQRFHQFIVDGMKSNQQAFKKFRCSIIRTSSRSQGTDRDLSRRSANALVSSSRMTFHASFIQSCIAISLRSYRCGWN